MRFGDFLSCAALVLTTGAALGAQLAPRSALGRVPRRPFPQHVVYTAGSILPNRYGRAVMDADVAALYDAWKRAYLVPMGGGRYRVRMGRGAQEATVSEGQGYGMLLAAYMAGYDAAAQAIFDGLWRFARDHPSRGDGRLMDWWVNWDESPDSYGDDSAFDGDCDMAYALLLAAAQWGRSGGEGSPDYLRAGRELIAAVDEATIGPQSLLPMLGDWVEPWGWDYNQYSPRSSDLMPGHFRAFGRATGDPRWAEVAAAGDGLVEQMQGDFAPVTGLLPDFMVSSEGGSLPLEPAWAFFLEGPWDGQYSYNACRDPWRLGVDALVTGDEAALARVRRIADWVHAASGGDPWRIRAGYTLGGAVLPGADYFTTAFAAPFAVAAMTVPARQAELNDLYDAVRSGEEDYYEDSIRLLCMLVLSGNWWVP